MSHPILTVIIAAAVGLFVGVHLGMFLFALCWMAKKGGSDEG